MVYFSPEENLLPTRIPYEESSIYSKLNLFSPNNRKFIGNLPNVLIKQKHLLSLFLGVNNARVITLHPGEVLFLPHGWWHYVENKEIAISINVWLPHVKAIFKNVCLYNKLYILEFG